MAHARAAIGVAALSRTVPTPVEMDIVVQVASRSC